MAVKTERDLGEFLVEQGAITPVQFRRAWQARHQMHQNDLGRVLVDLGYVAEVTVLQARAAMQGLAFIDLDDIDVDPSALSLLSADVAIRHRIMAVQKDRCCLTFATCNLEHCIPEEDVRLAYLRYRVRWVVAPPEAIDAAIARYYGASATDPDG